MKLEITLSKSDFRWISQLAKASGCEPCQLYATATTALADAAGRRPGSWEAEIGEKLCFTGLDQEQINACGMADEAENEEERAKTRAVLLSEALSQAGRKARGVKKSFTPEERGRRRARMRERNLTNNPRTRKV